MSQMQRKLKEFFYWAGVIVGIPAGLVAIFKGRSQFSLWFASTLTLLCLVLLAVAYYLYARGKPKRLSRNEMISYGKRYLGTVRREVVLFGGDLTWARDYGELLADLVNQGRKVFVVHPRSAATEQTRNYLRQKGAQVIETQTDVGFRGFLIDPDESVDAIMLLAHKDVDQMRHGTDSEPTYLAQEFSMSVGADKIFVSTVIKLWRILETSSEARFS